MQSVQLLKWQSEPKDILDLHNPVQEDELCKQRKNKPITIPANNTQRQLKSKYPDIRFSCSRCGSLDVLIKMNSEPIIIGCLDCDNRTIEEKITKIYLEVIKVE